MKEKDIYILGVPVDVSFDDKKKLLNFENILKKAQKLKWPIYAASDKKYFDLFTPDGSKILKNLNIEFEQIHISVTNRKSFLKKLAYNIIEAAKNCETPMIFLRPGNPEIGDVPVEIIIRHYQSNPQNIEISGFTSGPDVVGYYAEKKLGLKTPERVHFSGKQFINTSISDFYKNKLIIIRSLSYSYDDNKIRLFESVLQKILAFNVGYIYLKCPEKEGEIKGVKDLLAENKILKSNFQYTLAFHLL